MLTGSKKWEYYLQGDGFCYVYADFIKQKALVIDCEISEQLMMPYKINITTVINSNINSKHLGLMMRVELGSLDHPFRIFTGMLFKYEYVGSINAPSSSSYSSIQHIYNLEIHHSLYKLFFDKRLRIFQAKPNKDIISEILNINQIECKWLTPYCDIAKETNTQYNERTLDYIVRLMEEVGYFGYFEMMPSIGTLTMHEPIFSISRDMNAQKPIDLSVTQEEVGEYDFDRVISIGFGEEIYKDSATLYDFNIDTGSVIDNNDQKQIDPQSASFLDRHNLKHDIYPSSAMDPGQIRADVDELVRLEEIQSATFKAETTCFNLAPGRHVLFVNSNSGLKQKFFVETIIHTIKKDANNMWSYKNVVTGIAISSQYVPAKTIVKPVVNGQLTGLVVDGSGSFLTEDDYNKGMKGAKQISTNKTGLVRVRFMWSTKNDCSAWLRVMQWGNSGNKTNDLEWGNTILPRVGSEVVLGFLNGDVDCPIILGSLYNKNADNVPEPHGKTLMMRSLSLNEGSSMPPTGIMSLIAASIAAGALAALTKGVTDNLKKQSNSLLDKGKSIADKVHDAAVDASKDAVDKGDALIKGGEDKVKDALGDFGSASGIGSMFGVNALKSAFHALRALATKITERAMRNSPMARAPKANYSELSMDNSSGAEVITLRSQGNYDVSSVKHKGESVGALDNHTLYGDWVEMNTVRGMLESMQQKNSDLSIHRPFVSRKYYKDRIEKFGGTLHASIDEIVELTPFRFPSGQTDLCAIALGTKLNYVRTGLLSNVVLTGSIMTSCVAGSYHLMSKDYLAIIMNSTNLVTKSYTVAAITTIFKSLKKFSIKTNAMDVNCGSYKTICKDYSLVGKEMKCVAPVVNILTAPKAGASPSVQLDLKTKKIAISVDPTVGIVLNGFKKSIEMQAMTIAIQADKIQIKSKAMYQLEAGMLDIKANAIVKLEAGAMLTLKGAMVKIN